MEQQTTTVTPPPVGTAVYIKPRHLRRFTGLVQADVGNGFINVVVHGDAGGKGVRTMVPHKSLADTNNKGYIIEDYWDFIP